MKKVLALVLAAAMTIALTGCGEDSKSPAEVPEASGQTGAQSAQADDRSPLELAQEAYQALDVAAGAADMVGSDICTAWHAAIWDADKVVDGGAAYLAERLTMEEDKIREGIAHMSFSETDGDWASITDEQWEELRQNDGIFAEAEKQDTLFDCCINVVWAGYLESGIYDVMDERMALIKENIRGLQEKDPENEYIESLKEFYTVVHSYMEWCKKPEGSYNEADELLSAYLDDYRSCRDALEFDLGE